MGELILIGPFMNGPILNLASEYYSFRYGLVVRIPGSHPGGPGSIPGNGI